VSVNIIVRPRTTLLTYIYFGTSGLFQGISASSSTRPSFMSPLILRTEVSVILYTNQFHRVNTNTPFWHNALSDLG